MPPQPPPGFVLEQPQAPAIPRVIEGPPRQPPPQTPASAETDRLNALRAAEQLARDREALTRDRRENALGNAGQAIEAERRAAAYFTRALAANRRYEEGNVGPRNMAGQIFHDIAPNLQNTVGANSAGRQRADAQIEAFVNATLRADSGAAIPEPELARFRATYFPTPGEGPEAIAEKAQLRRELLTGLMNAAGRSLRPEDRTAFEQLTQGDAGGGVLRTLGSAVGREMGSEGFDAPTSPSAPTDGSPQSLPVADAPRPGGGAGHFELSGDTQSVVDPNLERMGSEFVAALRGGASREELVRIVESYGTPLNAAQRAWIDDPRNTGPAGRQHWTANNPLSSGFSLVDSPETVGGLVGGVRSFGASAPGAAVINYLDTASLGAGGLISQDYSRGMQAVREAHPIASTVGALAGGVRMPFGWGRTLGGQAARGAGYGGVYGFNSSQGGVIERLEGAGAGTMIGAAVPVALRAVGAGSRAALGRLMGRGTEANPGAVAASELDIPLMPGDVGGATIRRLSAVGAQLPFSTGTMTNAYEATVTAGQRARDRIASSVGEALDVEAGGEAARTGALSYRSTSRDAVNRAYDNAINLAADTRITPTNALEALDRNIAELGESPMGVPAELSALRNQLAGEEGFTVAGLRQTRTRLRDDFASKGLRGSDTERRAMQVVDALSEDINTGLTSSGRSDAALAYRNADQLHRQRIETIDGVIAPIIGRQGEKSGEEIVQALQRASRGNSRRLAAFINALPADESAQVRATLIGQLGRSAPGAQNAAGNNFSLETFLTHFNAMTPSARRTVFGAEGTSALNQLAEVAEMRQAAGRFANRSNTGSVVGGLATGSSILGGIPAFVLAAASQYGLARILTSPRLVRFLANMPREPERAGRYIGRLNLMARSETNPVLSQQIFGLRDALLRAANDNIAPLGRAAASPNERPEGE